MTKQNFTGLESWRPTVTGRRYAVSTGHYLATAAAMRALDAGGNAVDAGVTASMALAVLQPDVVSFAGVAPTLIYTKQDRRVTSLEGLGYWPAATDTDLLRQIGGKAIPEGILQQIVPAAPATHIEALRRFGTFSFEQAATPAYELAKEGFSVYPALHDVLEQHAADIDRYPENSSIFRPGGITPSVGSLLKQPDLANTIWKMIEAERKQPGGREKKLRAAHDCFYKGPIADTIAEYHRENGGFMSKDDLAGFEVPVARSIHCNYHTMQIHSCDVWCQGIVLLESLKFLEGIDLSKFQHNEPQYLHLIAQVLELAFADREAYVGDPKFMDVPTDELLSDTYAAQQRKRLRPSQAFIRPEPGMVSKERRVSVQAQIGAGAVPPPPDTIYACVVDAHGNAYSATPSDTMYNTPIVPGTGLAISARGMQSRLQDGHPCSVAPGKRPRLTPTPAIALEGGDVRLVWGTPGGDIQCQAMLQVLLNIVQFDMTVQRAIESPRIGTYGYPSSFPPNHVLPGRLCIESRIPESTVQVLQKFGYDIERWPEASWLAGSVCAIWRAADTGLLHAGADPRRCAYAAAW